MSDNQEKAFGIGTKRLDNLPIIPATVTRGDILDKAKECVTKDRANTHGDAEESFTELAQIWSIRTGTKIEAWQVCIMLSDLKSVRAWHNPKHRDNWDDGAGYYACGGELALKD